MQVDCSVVVAESAVRITRAVATAIHVVGKVVKGSKGLKVLGIFGVETRCGWK
jgi:hypothetical protein